MRAALFLVAIAACWSPPPPSARIAAAPPPPPKPRAQTPLARGLALERGDGAPRDYEAAVGIYREACAEGAGDLASCRRLVRNELASRGAADDILAIGKLESAMCERDDLLGCILASMSGGKPSDAMREHLERLVAVPCDAQHPARCEIPLDPFGGFSQSGSHESADNEAAATGCDLGVLDACIELRYARGDEHDHAMVVVTAACKRGDADACDAVDQPLPADPLCRAHDYQACIALGCAGDLAAATIAHAHAPRLGRDTPDCNRRYPYTVGAIASAVRPKPQLPFDSLALHTIASGGGAPWFFVANTGTRLVDLAIGELYAYDAGGAQVSRTHIELRNRGIAAGEGTLLDALGTDGVTFELCIAVLVYGDDRVQHLARCPDHKARGVRWGTGGDNLRLLVSLSQIPLADPWVSAFDPALAEPFEQNHPGILVNDSSGGPASVVLAPPKPDRAELERQLGPGALSLPFVVTSVSIAFHVPGLDHLDLSPPTLARIFTGKIDRWNDPAILGDNPGRVLPALPITVIAETGPIERRLLETYLPKLAPLDKGITAVKAWARPLEIGAKIAETDGAIGFVGPGIAAHSGLAVARLPNTHHTFVSPTSPDYPLAAPRALFLSAHQPDRPTADAVRAYASWLLSDEGLAILERLGYTRAPASQLQISRGQLATITSP